MILAQKNILYLNKADKHIVDLLSFHSARLYNSCCYNLRQYFFANNEYLPFKEQYHQIKSNENFTLLINDSAQQVLRMVDKNYRSFFSLLKLKAKGKYSANPSIPAYLPKTKGWSVFVAGRSCRVKNNKIHIGLSKEFKNKYNIEQRDLILPFPKNIGNCSLHQIQIKPLFDGQQYEIIVAYEKNIKPNNKLNKSNYLSIDCGLDNLLTCYDSKNKQAFIIDGKYLKSVNQFFNKEKSRLQGIYDKTGIKLSATRRFARLSNKRNNIINNYFNYIVKYLTEYCVRENIGTLIIGDFSGIKQEINTGHINNQNFVSIPYYKLKGKLKSKCEMKGITYELQEESYTSKCSAIDLEDICKKEVYMGKRKKRGLYVSKEGIKINADVNGAINILRKYLKSKSNTDLTVDDVRVASTNQVVRLNLRWLYRQAAKSLV